MENQKAFFVAHLQIASLNAEEILTTAPTNLRHRPSCASKLLGHVFTPLPLETSVVTSSNCCKLNRAFLHTFIAYTKTTNYSIVGQQGKKKPGGFSEARFFTLALVCSHVFFSGFAR